MRSCERVVYVDISISDGWLGVRRDQRRYREFASSDTHNVCYSLLAAQAPRRHRPYCSRDMVGAGVECVGPVCQYVLSRRG